MYIKQFLNTSRETHAQIGIRIVWIPPVDVHPLGIEITQIHEVAVRIAHCFLYISIYTTKHFVYLYKGCICFVTKTHALRCHNVPAFRNI